MRLSVIAATVAALFSSSAIAADLTVDLGGGNNVPINSSRLKKRMEVQIAAEKETISTDLKTIYRDYQANEVAGDAKYKGRWIIADGRVTDIGKDFTGDPYLSFGMDQYGLQAVRVDLFKEQICDVSKEKGIVACPALDKAAKLKKGQKLQVECRGAGMTMKIPMLKDCLIFEAK